MATLVAFCTASASSWKKNNASEKVVAEAINRQVTALARWRMRDFLGLVMGEFYIFKLMNNIRVVVALRGVAALTVALFHIVCAPMGFMEDLAIRSLFLKGASGVQMFFIISGLVIPLSLIRTNFQINRLGRFMLKRTIRIEPTYLAMIALSMGFIALREFLLQDGGTAFPSARDFFLNVTYLVPFFDAEWINAVFWTLGVELQYYLLIAMVWPLANKLSHPIWLLLLPLLGVLGREYTTNEFITHWVQFFNIGIVLALYLTHRINRKVFLVVEVICLGCVFYGWDLFYASLATATLAVIYIFPQKTGGRVFQFIGKQSYSLYLIHGLTGCTTVNLAMRFIPMDHGWQKVVVVLLAVVVSLISAQLLFLLVERPTMNRSKRINLN